MNCAACSANLVEGAQFCLACGASQCATTASTNAPTNERLCGTSGKPIREHNECLRCKDCEEFHLEQYRFKDGIAICKTCAHQDGSAEAYELEQQRKAKEEADKLAEIQQKIEAEYRTKLDKERKAIETRLER